jgi:hypothetical protein
MVAELFYSETTFFIVNYSITNLSKSQPNKHEKKWYIILVVLSSSAFLPHKRKSRISLASTFFKDNRGE